MPNSSSFLPALHPSSSRLCGKLSVGRSSVRTTVEPTRLSYRAMRSEPAIKTPTLVHVMAAGRGHPQKTREKERRGIGVTQPEQTRTDAGGNEAEKGPLLSLSLFFALALCNDG